MNVVVHLFGPQAQLAGEPSVTVALPAAVSTCAALRAALAQAVPALAPSLPASRFAINHDFASDAQRIMPDDEIALIGMVSGG